MSVVVASVNRLRFVAITMAETVKKSRIVSDDDLEESLMQEFNIRLKYCMGQEQTQEPSEDEEEDKKTIKMEFNRITTNGNQDDSIYDEVCPINSNERFLYEERNVYFESNGLPLKNGLSQEVHDKIREQEESLQDLDDPVETPAVNEEDLDDPVETPAVNEEVIYDEVKNVRPVLQLPTTCLTESESIDQDGQDLKSSVKDRMFLSTDDTSCLLFTQTVTSPMLTPSEENIDFLKGFQRESSQTTTSTETTNSENVPSADQQIEDATESSNISDKLDVEYENMQQVNTDNDVSEVDNLGPTNLETIPIQIDEKIDQENIYEVIEDDHDDKQEEIYENMEILRKQSIEQQVDKFRSTREFLEKEIMEEDKLRGGDNIYENIEDTEEEDIELSNAESIEEIQHDDVPEKSIPDVCLEANEKLDSKIEKDTEVIYANVSQTIPSPSCPEIVEETIPSPSCPEIVEEVQNQKQEDATEFADKSEKIETVFDSDIEDKSIDNPSKMVDALKTRFLSSNVTGEVSKSASIEPSELSQLKAVDIMKQIHKFEGNSPGKEDEVELDEETNNSSSTEMTESTYVETTTTTFESSSASVQDKSLKKKKSKKSRSYDKENISVNDTNIDSTNTQEDNFYNVNVKNLCRSFGDLTKIEDEKQSTKEKTVRDRTKSLGDARSFDMLKMVDNVFGEVSVKALLLRQNLSSACRLSLSRSVHSHKYRWSYFVMETSIHSHVYSHSIGEARKKAEEHETQSEQRTLPTTSKRKRKETTPTQGLTKKKKETVRRNTNKRKETTPTQGLTKKKKETVRRNTNSGSTGGSHAMVVKKKRIAIQAISPGRPNSFGREGIGRDMQGRPHPKITTP
ncbi:hypothetical protein QE152_g926 [Popillia japonica]|uniref:Uncharacterized protein n=1 Tax=Popillia japonica TaxID=7064 RepID=A0AAW1N4R2_POPJA